MKGKRINMKQNLKRCLSLALSAVLCLSLVPASAIPARAAADGSVSISEKTFPDPVFRAHVQTLPGAEDGVFTAEELGKIDKMYYNAYEQPGEKKIKDLTGLHHFYALTYINFNDGLEMESLNLFSNPKLELVQCAGNGLKNLDVSHNPKLQALTCGYNPLGELDVSHNPELVQLECDNNNLTHLDLRRNPKLDTLKCQKNQLKELNLVMQSALYHLECEENELTRLDLSRTDVSLIKADFGRRDMELVLADGQGLEIMGREIPTDPVGCTVKYGNCVSINDGVDVATFRYNGHTTTLKRFGVEQGLAIDEKNFPDPVFRDHVKTLPGAEDGVFTDEELARITEVDCHGQLQMDPESPLYIRTLKGIELFPNLEKLDCNFNGALKELDVSHNPKLTYLDTQFSSIGALDLSNNPELEYLNISQSLVKRLDLSHNPKLKSLKAFNNFHFMADGLDLSHNPELEYLAIEETSIEMLDLSQNSKLTYLEIGNTRIEELDVSSCPELVELNAEAFESVGDLKHLDVSGSPKLKKLTLTGNHYLDKIDVSNNPELEELAVSYTGIQELDISHNPKLMTLSASGIKLKTLDTRGCPELEWLTIMSCQLEQLDLTENTKLKVLYTSGNQNLKELDVSQNRLLEQFGYGGAKPGEDMTLFIPQDGIRASLLYSIDRAELTGGSVDSYGWFTFNENVNEASFHYDVNGGSVTTTLKRHPEPVHQTITTPEGVTAEVVTDPKGGITADIQVPENVEKASLTIPVENVTNGTVAVMLYEDGTEEVIRTCLPVEGGVKFAVTGNVKVKLVDRTRSFDDVPADQWFVPYVQFSTARGLFSGISPTEFGPDIPMTRSMLAVVLRSMDDDKDPGKKVDFPDVPDHEWYADAVTWAANRKIVSGYPDGRFGPEDPITREQLALMLYNYAGKPAVLDEELTFADSASVSPYARTAINWAVQNGILSGVGGNMLSPQGLATRAVVSTMLMRFVGVIL